MKQHSKKETIYQVLKKLKCKNILVYFGPPESQTSTSILTD